jgi:hypothetical protein
MFFTFKSADINNWSILWYVGLLVIGAFFVLGAKIKKKHP